MTKKGKPYFDEAGNLYIRPYRLKDLAAIYGMSNRTLRKSMNENEILIGRKCCKYFSVEQVSSIVKALGFPYKLFCRN
jgi:hypothetical protein